MIKPISFLAAFLICSFFICSPPCLSATIYVPKDYPTIQLAIDKAFSKDLILVSPGTYVENINFKGKNLTLRSIDGPETTTIDGSKSAAVVTFKNKEGVSALLEGFTLTNGDGGILCIEASPTIQNNIITKNETARGAGICCDHNSSPYIKGNRIMDNIAKSEGGGVACYYNCMPQISQNKIIGNSAKSFGGGVLCAHESFAKVVTNQITNNSAAMGAGVFVEQFSNGALIINNTIHNNLVSSGVSAYLLNVKSTFRIEGNKIAYNEGHGVMLYGAKDVTFSNNLIHHNARGGLSLSGCWAVIGTNNTIAYNASPENGGGVYLHGTEKSILTLSNSILWKNTAKLGAEIYVSPGSPNNSSTMNIEYSTVMGGMTKVYVGTNATFNWGAGMISSNPMFLKMNDDDFHLGYNSPCRDSGDNSFPDLPIHDIDGDPRIVGGTVDMGADEFDTRLYYTKDAVPGGMVNVKILGVPGTNPVHLWVGTGVLANAVLTPYGYWHLEYPIIFQLGLGTISSPNGAIVIPYYFSPTAPPMTYPLQAFVGNELTNLCVMELK